MTDLASNVSTAMTAVGETADPQVKAAVAAAAVTASIPPPSPAEAAPLWKILVGGLVAVLILALGGIIWTVADSDSGTSPDVIVTVFSSALTGLIGLFVKSPTET
jgi:hypothetical protein